MLPKIQYRNIIICDNKERNKIKGKGGEKSTQKRDKMDKDENLKLRERI